jgi:uncharacterized protein
LNGRISGELEEKAHVLRDVLARYESLLIAFSGGADSAYLAWEATSILGPHALCITADSPSYPIIIVSSLESRASSTCATKSFTRRTDRGIPANPTNRCYYLTGLYDAVSH